MKILDRNDPVFRHTWVRYATAFSPMIWGVVEFVYASPGWGILFLAAGIYAFWELFLRASD